MSGLVLSLDTSTNATGWAIFDGNQLLDSGVVKHKSKSYLERAKSMATDLKMIQLRAISRYGKHFSDIAIEKNNVGGINQQSVIKIGIATGIVLDKLIAEEIYFVNVSTWRKYHNINIKGKGKKNLKQQAIDFVEKEYQKTVKDDEADAILIGRYFVNTPELKNELEKHRLSI